MSGTGGITGAGSKTSTYAEVTREDSPKLKNETLVTHESKGVGKNVGTGHKINPDIVDHSSGGVRHVTISSIEEQGIKPRLDGRLALFAQKSQIDESKASVEKTSQARHTENAALFGIQDYEKVRAEFSSVGMQIDGVLDTYRQYVDSHLTGANPMSGDHKRLLKNVRHLIGTQVSQAAKLIPEERAKNKDPHTARWVLNGKLNDKLEQLGTVVLPSAKYWVEMNNNPDFRKSLEGSKLYKNGVQFRAFSKVVEKAIKKKLIDKKPDEIPTGLLGNPSFWNPNGEKDRIYATLLKQHSDKQLGVGNIEDTLDQPELKRLQFLNARDQEIEAEVMTCYLAATCLQCTPVLGTPFGIAADAVDAFSSHDATLEFLKKSDLAPEDFQMDKSGIDNVMAMAGLALEPLGLQGLARTRKLGKVLRRLGKVSPKQLDNAFSSIAKRLKGKGRRPGRIQGSASSDVANNAAKPTAKAAKAVGDPATRAKIENAIIKQETKLSGKFRHRTTLEMYDPDNPAKKMGEVKIYVIPADGISDAPLETGGLAVKYTMKMNGDWGDYRRNGGATKFFKEMLNRPRDPSRPKGAKLIDPKAIDYGYDHLEWQNQKIFNSLVKQKVDAGMPLKEAQLAAAREYPTGKLWIRNGFDVQDVKIFNDEPYVIFSPRDISPADISPADISPADISPADISPADISPD